MNKVSFRLILLVTSLSLFSSSLQAKNMAEDPQVQQCWSEYLTNVIETTCDDANDNIYKEAFTQSQSCNKLPACRYPLDCLTTGSYLLGLALGENPLVTRWVTKNCKKGIASDCCKNVVEQLCKNYCEH